MTTIPELAEVLQRVLGPSAQEIAVESGFTQRRSKLTGPRFAQTLVFGWMAQPQATLEELTQMASTLGLSISPQGLDQRFTRSAALFMKQVLENALGQMVGADPVALPLLRRFNGVYLIDSTVIGLSDALQEEWPGCGGRMEQGLLAALKIQVRFDLLTGSLERVEFQAGRTHDAYDPTQAPLPAGALRLADLGYFSLKAFPQMNAQGVYWLSRYKVGTLVADATGEVRNLWEWLGQEERRQGERLTLEVKIGRERLACRLLAMKAPPEVVEQRRRRQEDQARKKQQPVSSEQRSSTQWTIYLTNAPATLIGQEEAEVFGRTRWQIEQLFKLWKSHGRIDEWRTQQPWRMMCEIYAKLMGVLIEHWVVLVSSWRYPDRSRFKAAKTISGRVSLIAGAFSHQGQLESALELIRRCLMQGCRINKRKTNPHTYQLLLRFPP